MSIDILINQLDSHNEANIIITQKFNPKKVIYLYKKEEKELMESINKYYKKNFSNIILENIYINEGDTDKLLKICTQDMSVDTLINLTGGSRINSLILFNISKENLIKSIYLDVINKKIFIFNKKIEINIIEFDDLNLEKIIKSTGGDVLQDSTDFSNKKDLIILSQYIYKNLEIWHAYKQRLYDSTVFKHDYNRNDIVVINTIDLDNKEVNLLNKILFKIKEMNGIDYIKEKDNEIKVIFKNNYLKSFIFKSGTWLEIVTKNLIDEIKDIDEVRSGVMFLWNDKSKIVRNEVDVIAMKDCIPICVSCKDSDKYNEDTLNELDVYSEKIGGKNTFKILVATKEPIKNAVKIRAKEMGINIIIFDGNEDKFKDSIKNIIK